MISVIIPLFNKEPIIERTIRSVLNQSCRDYEIIVVDDGSTDNSVAVVERMQDDKIKIIKQKNGGPGMARNTGVANAKGNWVLFLDADDELTAGALDYFQHLLVSHKEIDFFCCEFIVQKDGKIEKRYEYHDVVVNNGFKSWFYGESCPRTGATLYRKSLVKDNPFDERIRRFEDLECLFRMFRSTKIFLSHYEVLTMNADYVSASSPRKSIKEDFLGYLDFKGKSFWERTCLYQFYLWERNHYSNEVDELYPSLRKRYDLLLLNKALHFLKNHHVL